MKDGKKKEVRSPKKPKKYVPAYKLVLKDGALEYHLLSSNSTKRSK